jgi:uncharacterized protein YkwD
MAGLVPAIHVFVASKKEDVDARNKRGHDDVDRAQIRPLDSPRFGQSGAPSSHARLGNLGQMRYCHSLRRQSGRLGAIAVLALLGACAGDRDPPPGEPAFYRSLAQSGGQLDPASAASMISGYRRNNGLPAVSIDPELMALAQAQAEAMASRDKLGHDVAGAFDQRLKARGYRARAAAENVGAGYHTLAEAFSGWRDSPGHRANMLLSGATRMGIAAVYTPKSKYKVYWALVLAAPDERPASVASSARPGFAGLYSSIPIWSSLSP